jgi:gas vesicle protein
MASHDSDFGAFLVGFIVGGLVGAATALMLAPQSGEQTRTLIRDKSIELKDKASETAELTRGRAEKAAADARARAEELAAQAKERAEELRKRGQQVFEEQRQKVEAAIQSGLKSIKTLEEPSSETPAPSPEAPEAL